MNRRGPLALVAMLHLQCPSFETNRKALASIIPWSLNATSQAVYVSDVGVTYIQVQ